MEQHVASQKHVKLSGELAELSLQKGQVGVVLNSWREPTLAYEVEFECAGQPMRVLLLGQQINALTFDG